MAENNEPMKMQYQWKPGADNTSLDPELVVAELDKIQQANNGMLTPAAVVEAARDIRSPLHSYFEWDEQKASQKHWLWQARHMINHIECVVVNVQREEREPITIRLFTNVVTTEGRGYFRTELLIRNRDTARIVIEQAWAELQAIKRKYNQLKVFDSVFRAMESVRKKESLPIEA